MPDPVDIQDLQSFIDGLQHTFDSLDKADTSDSKGMQAQLAKAISQLREKRLDKIKPIPKLLGHVTKEDLKKFFLGQLNELKKILESNDYPEYKRFELVKQIAHLRAKINTL